MGRTLGLAPLGGRVVEGTAGRNRRNGDGHKGKPLALGVGQGGSSPSLEMGKTGLGKALWDPVSAWGQPSSG